MSGADLFHDGPEEGADDGFAPQFPQPKRGPGRPSGALNRKTLAIKALYEAKGFRDPVLGMGDLVSSDPLELWKWLREQHMAIAGNLEGAPTLLDVVKLQQAARADLAPYIHGKQPIRIDTGNEQLPVLIIDMGTDQVEQAKRFKAGDQALSIGQPVDDAEIVQNQGVSDDAE